MLEVAAAVIVNEGKVLLCQRPEGKSCAGGWEFPGGKLEEGEAGKDCIVREIREELALDIVPLSMMTEVVQAGDRRTIHLLVYRCAPAGPGKPVCLEHQALRWLDPADPALAALPLCPADRQVVQSSAWAELCREIRKSATRPEHDSMGEVHVPADRYWGAQTERSRLNFPIGRGRKRMPDQVIHAFGLLKKAAALANRQLVPARMTEEKATAIVRAADEVAQGKLDDHFPLVVYQTGSGTQTNMNVNEVIANRGNELAGSRLLHPNDDVNMSQSSNDTFPTALHIAAVLSLEKEVKPAVAGLVNTLKKLEEDNLDVLKCGRTHLQDATPIRFSQEISGWRASLETDLDLVNRALPPLRCLALGGTAVGTGLNAPAGFDVLAAEMLATETGVPFLTAENKFHALTSRDEIVFAHGALKALACDLMKIANDIRWLASGPRLGLGEITIPENEPGSSIMPGKVNPTQCEQITMICARVLGNDMTVAMAASQGNFELNVFLPVCIDAFLESAVLLTDGIRSFDERCVSGLKANRDKMAENMSRSLMLVTALSPKIGYENAAAVAKRAHALGVSLREACVEMGFLRAEEYDMLVKPEKMV